MTIITTTAMIVIRKRRSLTLMKMTSMKGKSFGFEIWRMISSNSDPHICAKDSVSFLLHFACSLIVFFFLNVFLFSCSLEHILPDNLFASPKKSAGGHFTVFSSSPAETDEKNTSSTTCTNNNTKLSSASPLNVASFKSCILQMSRYCY